MKKSKLLFLILFFGLTSNQLLSQTDEKITEAFFTEYKTNPTKAYDNLFANDNKWVKERKSDLETVKIKFTDLLSSLGNYYGYEAITEKRVGESYVLKTFLIKYERQPIRISFILYKPKNVWLLQNFSYDANVDDELGEAAKAYRLRYNF